MRYFICSLEKINLGIPAEQTERIVKANWTQTGIYKTEEISSAVDSADAESFGARGAFISLPALFRQEETSIFHGLVLKSALASMPKASGEAVAGDGIRTILLTPKIDIDLEIPDDAIRRLPETFEGVYSFFSGAYFNGDDETLILILNPKKLTEVYHD